ncbi:hypothetical protein EDD29_4973 [Actinocorallia herbida]|uniref:Uncharacterized protein n=1 Tax=Actinocorallia herbida TaxID=58109 RepID=A0A3N1D1H6_9ACTN|nr:hypothetical protein EDD29_4973 [Actinocorallia herbida]
MKFVSAGYDGEAEARLDAALPQGAITVRLTAQRTDSESCESRLKWKSIGLDAQGCGPARSPFSGTARLAAAQAENDSVDHRP